MKKRRNEIERNTQKSIKKHLKNVADAENKAKKEHDQKRKDSEQIRKDPVGFARKRIKERLNGIRKQLGFKK